MKKKQQHTTFSKNQQEKWHCLHVCKSLNVRFNRRQLESHVCFCCDVTLGRQFNLTQVCNWRKMDSTDSWKGCGIRKSTFHKIPVGVLNHLSQETETGGNLGNLTKLPASTDNVPREQYVLNGLIIRNHLECVLNTILPSWAPSPDKPKEHFQ